MSIIFFPHMTEEIQAAQIVVTSIYFHFVPMEIQILQIFAPHFYYLTSLITSN